MRYNEKGREYKQNKGTKNRTDDWIKNRPSWTESKILMEISQKYLCILERNRGEEGCEGAQVDWGRRNCG